jgi:hypothetical protein
MNKGGFSWKKFIGLSAAKSRASRKIGIPLTKSGRNQKVGRMVSKGCLGSLAVISIPLFILLAKVLF